MEPTRSRQQTHNILPYIYVYICIYQNGVYRRVQKGQTINYTLSSYIFRHHEKPTTKTNENNKTAHLLQPSANSNSVQTHANNPYILVIGNCLVNSIKHTSKSIKVRNAAVMTAFIPLIQKTAFTN